MDKKDAVYLTKKLSEDYGDESWRLYISMQRKNIWQNHRRTGDRAEIKGCE